MLYYDIAKTEGCEHKSAKALVISMLKRHLNISKDRYTVMHRENGAPYLYDNDNKEEAVGIYISISHSKDLCAAAISDKPTGIDIEVIRDLRGREKRIEARFLEAFKDVHFESDRFFKAWTLHEAYYKVFSKTAKTQTDLYKVDFSHFSHSYNGNEYLVCICSVK